MTAANGDRITVQRVTQTVAGEYREWTVTVRQSSPADRPASELTRAGAVAVLPTPVRDWLSAWLEGRMVHAGEHIVPRDLLAAALGQPDPCGTRVVSGGGVRSACLLPVGHDGDHQPSAHTAAPLFPIAEPEPAAPYAGRTAPRRTTPPEVPIRLWNANYTKHHDTLGRADDQGPNVWRVRPEKAEAARAWIQELRDDYGDQATLHAAVLDRPWSVRGWSFWDHPGLILRLEPMPKPPRVDQVLGRAPYAGPWPHLAKGDRIGVEHADGTITTHEFSGDPERPVADAPDPHRAMERNIRALHNIRDDIAGPAPEAYTMPDGVGLGTVPEYGQPVDTSCPEHGVDCVLPMPGGPNDRLSHGAQAASDVARSAEWLREHPTAMHPETAQTIARHGYGDLYARLDAIHDATAEEDQ